MQKFIIQGGSKIHGTIAVSGAKNHALKAFAAALLSTDTMELDNVPEIEDIFRLSDILRQLGVRVSHPRHGQYKLNSKHITTTVLPKALVPKLRAAIVLTGPLLARCGSVTLPHPGGCAIGRRPIDIFIAGFKAMGVKHRERNGLHYFTAPRGLHGTHFAFPTITVTGTETLMLGATLAQGTTTLLNAAREPEIVALASYLNSQGAKITGAGSSEITIVGVPKLTAGKCHIIPDRIEMLSFIFLALAANSRFHTPYFAFPEKRG
jgi:UDP-N-acetylglucosamine 1-carboxyvinyltransferase